MPLHEIFFWTAFFFLTGTLIASATINFPTMRMQMAVVGIATALAILIVWLAKKPYAPLALAILLGGLYGAVYDAYRKSAPLIFGHEIRIEGVIEKAEGHLDYQELTLANNVRITADRYPEFAYGDRVALTGIIKKSKSPLVRGFVNARYKKIEIIARHEGNAIKERLYAFKNIFENNLKKVLPSEKAAFLSGLTLGTTAEFSKEFLNDLRVSGTTHLVALSGSNISVIINALMFTLVWFLPRKKAFWPAIAVITLFVIMTGAESSLVRAAIMNGIFLVGSHYERLGSMRNAIIAAAFVMAVWNPLVPAFDLGFQLSFAAILGMAYLKPIIKKYSPWKNKELMNAISAQVAVMPVLAVTVGNANLVAIIPNMLIVLAIPSTVGLGFLTGALAFISPLLAFAPAWLANILLTYEMAVIHIFARFM